MKLSDIKIGERFQFVDKRIGGDYIFTKIQPTKRYNLYIVNMFWIVSSFLHFYGHNNPDEEVTLVSK